MIDSEIQQFILAEVLNEEVFNYDKIIELAEKIEEEAKRNQQ